MGWVKKIKRKLCKNYLYVFRRGTSFYHMVTLIFHQHTILMKKQNLLMYLIESINLKHSQRWLLPAYSLLYINTHPVKCPEHILNKHHINWTYISWSLLNNPQQHLNMTLWLIFQSNRKILLVVFCFLC